MEAFRSSVQTDDIVATGVVVDAADAGNGNDIASVEMQRSDDELGLMSKAEDLRSQHSRAVRDVGGHRPEDLWLFEHVGAADQCPRSVAWPSRSPGVKYFVDLLHLSPW